MDLSQQWCLVAKHHAQNAWQLDIYRPNYAMLIGGAYACQYRTHTYLKETLTDLSAWVGAATGHEPMYLVCTCGARAFSEPYSVEPTDEMCKSSLGQDQENRRKEYREPLCQSQNLLKKRESKISEQIAKRAASVDFGRCAVSRGRQKTDAQ